MRTVKDGRLYPFGRDHEGNPCAADYFGGEDQYKEWLEDIKDIEIIVWPQQEKDDSDPNIELCVFFGDVYISHINIATLLEELCEDSTMLGPEDEITALENLKGTIDKLIAARQQEILEKPEYYARSKESRKAEMGDKIRAVLEEELKDTTTKGR